MPPAAPAATPAPVAPSTPPSGSLSELVQQAGRDAAAMRSADMPVDGAAPALASPVAPIDPSEPPVVEAAPADPAAVVDPNAAPVPEVPVLTAEDLDFSDGTDPDSTSQDGKRHFFSENKSRRLQQAGKLVQALQEVMPVVTADAVRERVETANAADVLMTAYDQGTAQSVDEVVRLFQERSPDNFGIMAIRALQALPQVKPEAYKVVERQFTQNVVKNQYNRALSITDPAAQKVAIALAQNLDLAINGTFTKTDQLLAQGVQDPLKLREQQLAARESELNSWQANQRQQAQQTFDNQLSGAQLTAIDAVVAEALAPVKSRMEGTPQWDQMQTELKQQIAKAEAEHPEWAVQWRTLMNRAASTKSERDVNAVADYRRSVARTVARRNAQAIIQRASQAVTQSNQTAHQQAARTPAPEVSPNGGAISRPVDGALQKAISNPDLRSSLRDLFATVPGGR